MTRQGLARGGPDDHRHEEARQEHLEAHEHGLDPGHLDAPAAQLLGGVPVAAGEDLLAADPPQDAQARDGVGGDGGEGGLGLALDVLAPLEGADQAGGDPGGQGHAHQDDEPQGHRGTQHEDRHHQEGEGRPDQLGEAFVEHADGLGVGGHDGGDLPGGDLAGQGGAHVGGMAPHEALDVEGRPHPHVGGQVHGHGVGDGVEAEQPQEGEAEQPHAPAQPVTDPGVQGQAQEGGDGGLDDGGDGGGQGGGQEDAGAAACQPGQEVAGGAGGAGGGVGPRGVGRGLGQGCVGLGQVAWRGLRDAEALVTPGGRRARCPGRGRAWWRGGTRRRHRGWQATPGCVPASPRPALSRPASGLGPARPSPGPVVAVPSRPRRAVSGVTRDRFALPDSGPLVFYPFEARQRQGLLAPIV